MSAPELLALSSRLSTGAAQAFRTLAVVPLVDPTTLATGWLTLDQAIERELAEVTELSERGSVPHLKFLNRGPDPVFLLDGEELVGAKQNRILNLSILVPARADIEIPVSCVEQGRWSWRSRHFRNTERVIYSKLRRRNSEAVSASLCDYRSPRGDQGQVWNDIAMKSARMSVHSDTGSASALFEHFGRDLDEFAATIKVTPGQVGAAFVVNGRFAGLDLLGGPDLVAALLPKLVRSYALDVLEETDETDGAERPTQQSTLSAADYDAVVRSALVRVGQLSPNRTKAVGDGEDLRFREEDLVGSALIASTTVAHLSLWAADYH
jgi:hypothetical protein